jgi:hypothetical protein
MARPIRELPETEQLDLARKVARLTGLSVDEALVELRKDSPAARLPGGTVARGRRRVGRGARWYWVAGRPSSRVCEREVQAWVVCERSRFCC